MATGIEVVFISIATLLIIWAIVIYGSSYFGSN